MAWSSQLIKANMFWTPHLDRYTETIDKVPTSRVAVEGESSEEIGSSTPLKKNQEVCWREGIVDCIFINLLNLSHLVVGSKLSISPKGIQHSRYLKQLL